MLVSHESRPSTVHTQRALWQHCRTGSQGACVVMPLGVRCPRAEHLRKHNVRVRSCIRHSVRNHVCTRRRQLQRIRKRCDKHKPAAERGFDECSCEQDDAPSDSEQVGFPVLPHRRKTFSHQPPISHLNQSGCDCEIVLKVARTHSRLCLARRRLTLQERQATVVIAFSVLIDESRDGLLKQKIGTIEGCMITISSLTQ